MSRYTLQGYDPAHTVVVGYDQPLQTYFGTVIRPNPDPLDDTVLVNTLLDIGGLRLTTVERIRDRLAPWARLPPDVAEALLHDQVTAPPPTPLQQLMGRLFTTHEQGKD